MKKEEPVNPAEERLGHALVKAKLLSEAQLKTALDYQRSLGGSLHEVLNKLEFAHPHALSRFISDWNATSGASAPPAAPAKPVPREAASPAAAPPPAPVSELDD